ncbi:MAG: DsbA family protein [Devosiaceae bacterium]|nr:DsbA family protein [Devosiaceae bacterium]
MTITRRNALIMTSAASLASFSGVFPALAYHPSVPGGSSAPQGQVSEGVYDVHSLMNPKGWTDRAILGSLDAPATLIEYTSPTCPFCASFHNDTYPQLKTEFVDTGKLRLVVRPFIRNVLDAVVFMLADVVGDETYHNLLNSYFRTQPTWSRSDTPRDAIFAVAQEFGFTLESFESALTNQELFAGMEETRNQARDEFNLTGTPTFYINGKMLSGNRNLEQLAAEIEPLQV